MYMLTTRVDYCGTSQLRSSMDDQRSFESGPNSDVGSYKVIIWWILCIQCMYVIVIAHPGGMQYYY